jgi:hypothetical protein
MTSELSAEKVAKTLLEELKADRPLTLYKNTDTGVYDFTRTATEVLAARSSSVVHQISVLLLCAGKVVITPHVDNPLSFELNLVKGLKVIQGGACIVPKSGQFSVALTTFTDRRHFVLRSPDGSSFERDNISLTETISVEHSHGVLAKPRAPQRRGPTVRASPKAAPKAAPTLPPRSRMARLRSLSPQPAAK